MCKESMAIFWSGHLFHKKPVLDSDIRDTMIINTHQKENKSSCSP
jgi:hypothetical protein